MKEGIIWYRFKNNYIANEEKLEGNKLNLTEIKEIVTDIRVNGLRSKYSNSSFENVIEVAGQYSMFDFIFKNKKGIGESPIKTLHSMLYQYMPFPDAAGNYRTSNNLIQYSDVETTNHFDIYKQMYEVDQFIHGLIQSIDKVTYFEFIQNVVLIHHKITLIHPFTDGNGRTSRALINWLFYNKGIYPIYIDSKSKDKYYDGLRRADKGDSDALILFFLELIIDSDIALNDSLSIL